MRFLGTRAQPARNKNSSSKSVSHNERAHSFLAKRGVDSNENRSLSATNLQETDEMVAARDEQTSVVVVGMVMERGNTG